jgi:hypothetical protein
MKKFLYLLIIITFIMGTISCKTTINEDNEEKKIEEISYEFMHSNVGDKVNKPDESLCIFVTNNILLGTYKDGQWINSKQSEELVKGSEKFTFYSLSKAIGSGVNAKIEKFEGGSALDIERDFNSSRSRDNFFSYFICDIGMSGVWNALPRQAKSHNTNTGYFIDVVKDILGEKGLPESKIDIKRLIGVDLEGDGTEEVVISATDYELKALTPHTDIGSYSVIILRKIINGSVKNIIIKEQYSKEKPEYKYVFDCPLILDVDNDGEMELVIESRFGAWSIIEFYKVVDNKVNLIYRTYFGA